MPCILNGYNLGSRTPLSKRIYAFIYVRKLFRTMRLHQPLDDVLGSSVRVKVLRTLTTGPERGLSTPAIASRAGTSIVQALAALDRLFRTGVVAKERIGKTFVWHLDVRHALGSLSWQLFQKEGELLRRIRDEIRETMQGIDPVRAAVFGSAASRAEGLSSDLDLFVEVRNDSEKRQVRRRLSELGARLLLEFGIALNDVVVTVREAAIMPNQEFIREVRETGVPVSEDW